MKSIKVYASDEIIDDIKATAKKLVVSASRYLVNYHVMKQEKVHPGKERGTGVSLEVVRDISPAKISSGKKPKTASEWKGGYSKEHQARQKGGK